MLPGFDCVMLPPGLKLRLQKVECFQQDVLGYFRQVLPKRHEGGGSPQFFQVGETPAGSLLGYKPNCVGLQLLEEGFQVLQSRLVIRQRETPNAVEPAGAMDQCRIDFLCVIGRFWWTDRFVLPSWFDGSISRSGVCSSVPRLAGLLSAAQESVPSVRG